jgi:hypothetical protein
MSEKPETMQEYQDKLNVTKPEVLGVMLSRAYRLMKSPDAIEQGIGHTLREQILLAFQWQAYHSGEKPCERLQGKWE